MLDWDRVNELRDEIGEEDLADVLALFLEEVEERLTLLDAGSGAPLADDLHFVKSSALNIGFNALAEMSAGMETAARAGATTADIAGLRTCFHDACVALETGGVRIEAA